MRTILIIDDRGTLEPLLDAAFGGACEAIVARDGAEALRRIEERTIDGVLVNLMSPVLDGASFIRGLGLHQRAIPVVLASRSSDVRRLAMAVDALDEPTKDRGERRDERPRAAAWPIALHAA